MQYVKHLWCIVFYYVLIKGHHNTALCTANGTPRRPDLTGIRVWHTILTQKARTFTRATNYHTAQVRPSDEIRFILIF